MINNGISKMDYKILVILRVEIRNKICGFMVRELTYNWKLPVAYYLSAGPTKAEILEKIWRSVVSELLKIGLDVKASVCDQGAHNRKMFKNLGFTRNKPFNLNGKKIYALFELGSPTENLQEYS